MGGTEEADRPRVLVAEAIWGAPYDDLATHFTVTRLDRPATPDDLLGVSALVVRNRTRVTRELLGGAPALRVVARAGAGMDNIDVSAAAEHGVTVVHAPGANSVSVAEHAIGLALAVARRTTSLDRAVRSGQWQRSPGRELAGGVWGLVSAGSTARATGRLARALGMSVLAYDPYCDPQDPGVAGLGIELCPLDRVLATADVISVHLPHTTETSGMINSAFLDRVRPGAILVNVGRGDVVDESALVAALRSGRLAGAALDVRADEPPVPGELESMPNVVLTPHIAGITEQSQQRISEILCHELIDLLDPTTALPA